MEILLIAFAAICKAFADTLDHHFDTSIFRNKPRKYYDPNVINKTAPKIFGYPVDAWHVSNSLQICSWMALPVVYTPVFEWWVDYGIGGAAFVIVFSLFYNKIFRLKGWRKR